MLSKTFLSKTLNATSVLALSAILLGTTFSGSSWAMDAPSDTTNTSRGFRVSKLEVYADLADKVKPGDLVFLNVGHGFVHSCT